MLQIGEERCTGTIRPLINVVDRLGVGYVDKSIYALQGVLGVLFLLLPNGDLLRQLRLEVGNLRVERRKLLQDGLVSLGAERIGFLEQRFIVDFQEFSRLCGVDALQRVLEILPHGVAFHAVFGGLVHLLNLAAGVLRLLCLGVQLIDLLLLLRVRFCCARLQVLQTLSQRLVLCQHVLCLTVFRIAVMGVALNLLANPRCFPICLTRFLLYGSGFLAAVFRHVCR